MNKKSEQEVNKAIQNLANDIIINKSIEAVQGDVSSIKSLQEALLISEEERYQRTRRKSENAGS